MSLRTMPSIDEVADAIEAMTSLDIERLKTRFDIRRLVPASAEELRNRAAEQASEQAMRRAQALAVEARAELKKINDQIERKTEVLQALVRASKPKPVKRK
jgi:hypothetical protein